MTYTNALGQPIGAPLPAEWNGATPPPRRVLEGTHTRLEPIDPERHAADLLAAYQEDRENRIWTYLRYGPFESAEEYQRHLESWFAGDDPQAYAIIEHRLACPAGVATYLRIDPPHGSIEVGHICLAPILQRTVAATEAMFLMMRHAFDDLGYRRYEWKCDALNEPSRRAAERLGFIFEGIFRQAATYKGRNYDMAWYSILDRDWPGLKNAYQQWLAPGNFDADGRQRVSLSSLTRAAYDG